MKEIVTGDTDAERLRVLGVAHAQAPQILNYQGRIVSAGTNFTGTGAFKFALVNPGGTTTYWSNDGTSNNGAEPTSSARCTGKYGCVVLGFGC